MLSLFQKYFQGICLLLVVLLGVSLGRLAATGLGVYLSPPVILPGNHSREISAPSEKPALTDFQVVLQRDIFDSTAQNTGSLAPVAGTGEAAPAAAPRQNLTLFGTVAAGKGSLAVIRAGQDVEVFRLGQEVPGGGEVEEIGRNLVKVKYPDGKVEELPLYQGEMGESGPAPAAASGTVATDGNSAIKPIGENRWIIPQEEAEKARGNLNELLKQARMEPNIVDGRTEGFMVKMIRPNSFLAMLGIQRGDLVMQVNGMELNSPEKALQIFQQLREARHISIGLQRNGSPLTFEYEVE